MVMGRHQKKLLNILLKWYNMIPKIIHYCWFGRGEMPDIALKCISSWKKHLPDYELKLWNEDNFDINSVQYVKEAYYARKFAFVTDYVRLYAIYNEGGVYMDTDVEVLQNLDGFLNLPAFSGFESNNAIPTGIMASEKNGVWAKEQLELYNNRKFIKSDGTFDFTTNVTTITNSMKQGGFVLDNTTRNYKDTITMFSSDYFCPKSWYTGKVKLTPNTYCIHHFAGSWKEPDNEPLLRKLKYRFLHIIGDKNAQFFVKLKRVIKLKI